jgi:dihydropteroate synthase
VSKLDFSSPKIMGVLNVTPDSFSDGGAFNAADKAVERALALVSAGADIVDIGGESTRPGAATVSAQEEMDRVLPVVEALKKQGGIAVSVDTSTPEVMSAVLSLGVELINDVRAFQREGALEAVRDCDAHLCVMHMQGRPATMQERPQYQNVVDEVLDFLSGRLSVLREYGIADDQLLVDPGFGFGKTLEHNLSILRGLERFCDLGFPVLVGMSRKTMIGEILNKPVTERMYGSLAAALVALDRGASVLRVHDVAETADVVKVWKAVNACELK